MRKVQQKKTIEMLRTLGEANDELRRFFSHGEIPSVLQILSDCQEFAVQIGSYIENLAGEGTRTIALLERYCEELYNVSVEINNGTVSKNFTKRLGKTLSGIESNVRTELKPDRFEVAFMPYKRAMSDSLESIWQSALQDPQCDAYIVPIPYYDHLPNGELGQMHYEGNLYPNDLLITDWRKYDVETRHPDIIFIHYPYDDENYVTSLDPHFYSKRLKDCCDLLVYVPYFVCVGNVQEHFCVCAGTMYAGKVIVQSEKVRQTYIRVFKEFEKKNDCRHMFGRPEDKFVALGSPKFDAVINAKPDDFTLPDAWNNLIEKPDCTKKKIVLYNTTISAILNGGERYLEKLRSVLETFRKHDDVVLWWRPHPLNEATYRSMRPSLLGVYEEIVEGYRREGWGIYDDTPDLHRAIALSDAYYGDGGSMQALYQRTGKLMLIQSAKAVPDDNLHIIAFEASCDYNGCFWFVNYHLNLFYSVDKRSWETKCFGNIPNEKIRKNRLYAAIAEYNGKLYFAPGFANEIAVYDVDKNSFSKIEILPSDEIAETQNSNHLRFCDVVAYENTLFFISCAYPAFVRLDPQTNEKTYYSDWLKPLERLISDPKDAFFWHRAVVLGSCFYLACCNANAVVSFDMKALKSIVYEVGGKENRYSDICFDGKQFWLSPRNEGAVVRWSPETNQYAELWDFPDGFVSGNLSFNSIVYCAEHVWLFPGRANMALKISIEDGKISDAQEFRYKCDPLKTNYYAAFTDGKKIYAQTRENNIMAEFDCETGDYNERHILFENNNSDGALDRFFLDSYSKSSSYLVEDNFNSLEGYLAFLIRNGSSSLGKNPLVPQTGEREDTLDGTAGKSIFNFCKQIIGLWRNPL